MIEKNRLFIYAFLFISTIFMILINNLACFIILNVVLILLLTIGLRLDIKNPLVMFLLVFLLYQISYPILNFCNVIVFNKISLNENYYLYNWIATITFIISYGKFKKVDYDRKKLEINSNIFVIKLIYYIFCIFCIISSIFIIKNGFSSKYEISNSNSFILKLGNICYTGLIPISLYIVLSSNIKKNNKKIYIILTFLIMFYGMMTYGERSYLFNYIVMILILYFTFNKIKITKIITILIFSLLLLVSSSSMKMMLSTDRYSSLKNENFLISFLKSDFFSAGYNFNYILQKQRQFFYGRSYIYDLASPLDDVFPSIQNYSSTKWYTNKYWKNRKTGLGFSIIAEGYINFGLIGIIIQMIILSKIIKYMYIESNKNGYYYISYLGFLSLSMYSCREALGNIISPFVKYYILLMIIIYMISKITISNKAGESL